MLNLDTAVLNKWGKMMKATKLSIDARFDAIDHRIEQFARRIAVVEKTLARSTSTSRTKELK